MLRQVSAMCIIAALPNFAVGQSTVETKNFETVVIRVSDDGLDRIFATLGEMLLSAKVFDIDSTHQGQPTVIAIGKPRQVGIGAVLGLGRPVFEPVSLSNAFFHIEGESNEYQINIVSGTRYLGRLREPTILYISTDLNMNNMAISEVNSMHFSNGCQSGTFVFSEPLTFTAEGQPNESTLAISVVPSELDAEISLSNLDDCNYAAAPHFSSVSLELELRSTPSDASIYIDGELTEFLTDTSLAFPLKCGRYDCDWRLVTIRKEGFLDYTIDVSSLFESESRNSGFESTKKVTLSAELLEFP